MPYIYVIFLPYVRATLMTFLHLIVAGYPTLGERLEELTKQNKYECRVCFTCIKGIMNIQPMLC